MSAADRVSYVYEPFFALNINGTDIKDIMARNDVIASHLVRHHLTDLFECRTSYEKRKTEQKGIKTCETNDMRVIKTIRVRYNQIKSWIQQSDIKVYIALQ